MIKYMDEGMSVDLLVTSVPDCGCGEHLAIGPDAQNHDRGHDHYQICVMSKRRDQTHSYTKLFEMILIKIKDKKKLINNHFSL